MAGETVLEVKSADEKKSFKKHLNDTKFHKIHTSAQSNSIHDLTSSSLNVSPNEHKSSVIQYFAVQSDQSVLNCLDSFILQYSTMTLDSISQKGVDVLSRMLKELFQIVGFTQVNEKALLEAAKLYDSKRVVIPSLVLFLHCPAGVNAGADGKTLTGVALLNFINLFKDYSSSVANDKDCIILSSELRHMCSSADDLVKPDKIES